MNVGYRTAWHSVSVHRFVRAGSGFAQRPMTRPFFQIGLPMPTDASAARAAERAATLVASSLGAVIVLLNVTIANVATPYIGQSFDADVSALQWILNAYTLSFASLLLPAGVLGDRYGSRLVFMVGVSTFGLASLACAAAQSAGVLIAARVMQGAAAALVLPTALSLLAHANSGDELARARAVGWWSAIGGVVSAAGPALGGILIDSFGWPSIFVLNAPLCLLTLWFVRARVGETPKAPAKSFDIPGQVLAVLLFSAVTATFIEAGPRGWADPRVVAGGVISFALLLGFCVAERRAADPVLPLPLLRSPALSMPLLLGLVTNLAFYGLIFVLSVYFQTVRGYSPAQTGLAFLPLMVIMVGNVASASVAARFGYRAPVLVGLCVTAIGYVILGLLLRVDTSYTLILPCLLLMALGGGLTVPALTAILLGGAEQTRTATVSGIFNTGRQVGAALGVALFGALLVSDTPAGLASGVATAFAISGQLLLASTLLAAWLLPAGTTAAAPVNPKSR